MWFVEQNVFSLINVLKLQMETGTNLNKEIQMVTSFKEVNKDVFGHFSGCCKAQRICSHRF